MNEGNPQANNTGCGDAAVKTRKEQIRSKAKELGKKYFPDEANIWARDNIEAVYAEYACVEMAEWVDRHHAWVPVDKELPEKEEDNPSLSVNVIVTDGSSVFESYYSFNTHIWAGTDIYGTITHWMPMPIPPEPGKEEE